MYSQNITFTGGLNTDDEDRFITDGDYRNAFYSRNYGVGTANDGAVQSVTGNQLLENLDLPAGDNVIIGSCEDVEGKGYKAGGNIILFVYNTSRNHSIWRYNTIDNTYQLILQDSILNFQLDYKIYHAAVVNGLLYWTDNYFESYELDPFGLPYFNPPRKINIEKALLYTDSGGTDPEGYTEITFNNLDWIKHPPLFSPTGVYVTDTNESSNNLLGKLFQFRYQYVYDDNEESAWSPISDLILPNDNEYIAGITNINPYIDNTIDLTINTGSSISTIIRVAYRIGNTGEFFLYKEFDKNEQGWSNYSSVVINFKNETSGVAISNSERNYDLIPQIAKCVEYLPSNEFAIGNIVEGYDKPNLNGVDFDFDVNRNTINNTTFTAPLADFINLSQDLMGVPYRYNIISLNNSKGQNFIKYRFDPGDILILQLKQSSATAGANNNLLTPDPVLYYTVPAIDGTIYNTDILKINYLSNDLANFLNSNGISASVAPSGSFTYDGNLITWPTVALAYNTWYNQTDWQLEPSNTESYSLNINVLRTNNAKRTFKTGATHEFAIQYYDRANRDGTVLTIPTGSVYNPFYYDYQDSYLNNICSLRRKPFYTTMQMTIPNDFQPPIWATNYQILYKPSTNIANFQQRSVIKATYNPDTTVKLSLDNYYKPNYEGASINQTPSKGDFVRFVRKRALFTKENALLISNGLNLGSITRPLNPTLLDTYYFLFESNPPTNDHLTVICDPTGAFSPPGAFTTTLVATNYRFEFNSQFTLSWDLGYATPTSATVQFVLYNTSTGAFIGTLSSNVYTTLTNGMTINVNGVTPFLPLAAGINVSYGVAVEFAGGVGAYAPNATLNFSSYTMSVYKNNVDYDDYNYYPSYVTNTDEINYELNVLSYSPGDETEAESITVNYFDISLLGDYLFYTGNNDHRGFASGGFQIEIYTPKKESENDPWYETGIEWDILDPYTPNRRHNGNTEQIIGSQRGVVDLDCGDVYIRQRIMATGYDYDGAYEDVNDANDIRGAWFCEDPHYSDYYISNWNNKGRLGLYSPFAKRQELKATIYHTNSLIDNTQINGLSRVEFQNQVSLKDEHGGINKLIQIGDTLKAFQDRKISSIYVQKTFALNGDGTNNVIISDRTFAGVRPHDDDYGCIHPGSISKYENDVFAYDYFNSSVIRITQGGIINISDKMSKFLNGIRDFTASVDSIGFTTVNMWSHINRLHGEYALYISNQITVGTQEYEVQGFKAKDTVILVGDQTSVFVPGFIFSTIGAINANNNAENIVVISSSYNAGNDTTSIITNGDNFTAENNTPAMAIVNVIISLEDGESIHYSFLKQRWIYRGKLPVSFATQYGSHCFATGGNSTQTYGMLYEENLGGAELTFFGTSQNQQIHFPVNVNPTIVKRFLTFMTQSNMPFTVNVSVPATNQYPNGMASSIFVDNFNNQESYYVSKYFRDSSDPNPFLTGVLKRLNGRELRGYVLNHILSNGDTNKKMVLMSVQCNFVPSEPILQ